MRYYRDEVMSWLGVSSSALGECIRCNRIAEGRGLDVDRRGLREVGNYVANFVDDVRDIDKTIMYKGLLRHTGAFRMALQIAEEYYPDVGADALKHLGAVLGRAGDREFFDSRAGELCGMFEDWAGRAEEQAAIIKRGGTSLY